MGAKTSKLNKIGLAAVFLLMMLFYGTFPVQYMPLSQLQLTYYHRILHWAVMVLPV